MPTLIPVTRNLTVQPIVDITDKDFAHWYELGTWWAMYGEEQGTGPYPDRYLITNIQHGIETGWYSDVHSGWFPMLGLNLGMIHGGWLVRPSDTIVTLTDPDFAKGYEVGREYCFCEATRNERRLSDTLLFSYINGWALDYHLWREAAAVLRYVLGCRIGHLSSALLPQIERVNVV